MGLSLNMFDILGPTFTLNISGQEKLKSKVGSLLTLGFLSCFIVASGFFIAGFFDRTTPAVVTEEINLKTGPKVEFGRSNMLPLIILNDKSEGFDDEIDPNDVDNYLDIKLHVTRETKKKNAKGEDVPVNERVSYSAVPCKSLTSKGKFNYLARARNYQDWKPYIDEFAICIDANEADINKIFMAANSESPDSTKLTIVMMPCSGPLEADGGSCKPESDISKLSMELLFPTLNPDFFNYKDPTYMNIEFDNSLSIPDFALERVDSFKPINHIIYDEDQFTGSPKESGMFIELQPLGPTYTTRNQADPYSCEDPDSETCKPVYSVSFVNGLKSFKYTRKYKSATAVLSEIGGISTLLLQVFTYLNMIYLYFARTEIMCQQLFPSLGTAPSDNHTPNSSVKTEAQKENDKQRIKRVKELRTEAVNMIDSSIDLSILFKEICSIRVLTEIFLDDMQRNLVALSSLQVFRKRQKIAADTELNSKAQKSSKSKTKQPNEVQLARREHLACLQTISSRIAVHKKQVQKKGHGAGNGDADSHHDDSQQTGIAFISNQIDFKIKSSVQELGLEFLDPMGINVNSSETGNHPKPLNIPEGPLDKPHKNNGQQTVSELMNQLREDRGEEDIALSSKGKNLEGVNRPGETGPSGNNPQTVSDPSSIKVHVPEEKLP